MKIKKSIFFTLVTILSLGAIAFLIFWLPSFFTDEFNYVNVSFSDGAITITTDPSDLFEKNVSRWTEVSATFRNNSQAECDVAVKSKTLDKSFNVAQGSEYGFIIPKGKDINISFCGIGEKIRIN